MQWGDQSLVISEAQYKNKGVTPYVSVQNITSFSTYFYTRAGDI